MTRSLPPIALAVSLAMATAVIAEPSPSGRRPRMISLSCTPRVEHREWEIETLGYGAIDRDPELGGARATGFSIGHAPTEFWHVEVQSVWSRDDGKARIHLTDMPVANLIALTEPGEGWLDAAVQAN